MERQESPEGRHGPNSPELSPANARVTNRSNRRIEAQSIAPDVFGPMPRPIAQSSEYRVTVNSPVREHEIDQPYIEELKTEDFSGLSRARRQRYREDTENGTMYDQIGYDYHHEQNFTPFKKIPGQMYPRQGEFLGFNQRESANVTQIVVERTFEKTKVLWLLRGFHEAINSSRHLFELNSPDLHPFASLSPRKFLKIKNEKRENSIFFLQNQESWSMVLESQPLVLVNQTSWVIKVYPYGCDQTIPGHVTVGIQYLPTPEEEEESASSSPSAPWVKKLNISICISYITHVPIVLRETRFFTQQDKEQFFSIKPNMIIKEGAPAFFKNAAIFQIELTPLAVSAFEFNTQLQFLAQPEDFDELKREERVYQGIHNTGTMCYLISLLQTLFHIPAFRDFVFSIKSDEIKTVESSNSLPLALQKLFYNVAGLQMNEENILEALSYKTKPFRTNNVEPNMIEVGLSLKEQGFQDYQQEDISEFLLRIMDELERITLSDFTKSQQMNEDVRKIGAIYKLFNGDTASLIQCVNFPEDKPSFRSEIFTMLSLEVQNIKTVKQSLINLMSPEKLTGSNKYQSETRGLQDAWKWQEITSLPPVLFFTLKRFNFFIGAGQKVNSRIQFDQFLDMDAIIDEANANLQKEIGRHFKPHTRLVGRNKYRLLSIMMHAEQDVGMGHYYAYIKPEIRDRNSVEWLEFNDFTVRPILKDVAFQRAFGGEHTECIIDGNDIFRKSFGLRKYSAYMLCYLRESDLQNLFEPARVPRPLAARFDYENEMAASVISKFILPTNSFQFYLTSAETLAEWSGFGPLPCFEFGVSDKPGDEGAPIERPKSLWKSEAAEGIFRRQKGFRNLTAMEKSYYTVGGIKKPITFELFHLRIAKSMNLPPSCIRIWLCHMSRYNPEIMCVSSIDEDSPPQPGPEWEGRGRPSSYSNRVEFKKQELEIMNFESFSGSLFIELVQKQQEEWLLEDTSQKVFVKKQLAKVQEQEDMMEFYEDHQYIARNSPVVEEVEIYDLASYNPEENGEHPFEFSDIPEDWKIKIRAVEQEKKQLEAEQQKQTERRRQQSAAFQFVFNNAKSPNNTEITQSGGGQEIAQDGDAHNCSFGDADQMFSPIGAHPQKQDSLMGELGEDAPLSANLTPESPVEEPEARAVKPLTENNLDLFHKQEKLHLKARKQKLKESHEKQREQSRAQFACSAETPATLIFVKFYIRGNLRIQDIRGITLPSSANSDLHDPISVETIFKRYFPRFLSHFPQELLPEILIYKETSIFEFFDFTAEPLPQICQPMPLDSPLFLQSVINGDCFVLAAGGTPRGLSLMDYLFQDLTEIKVVFSYKLRRFEMKQMFDQTIKDALIYPESPFANSFVLGVNILESLEQVSAKLQERFHFHQNLPGRILYYKKKPTRQFAMLTDATPRALSFRCRQKSMEDKDIHACLIQDYSNMKVADILLNDCTICYNILPFERVKTVPNLLDTIYISALTNDPFLIRIKKDSQTRSSGGLDRTSDFETSSFRKQYEELLLATVSVRAVLSNLMEVQKKEGTTAAELKAEIFQRLINLTSMIPKANKYRKGKAMFRAAIDLKSIGQLIVLREAIIAPNQNLPATERIIMKIFTDSDLIWPQTRLLTELNCAIRVLIVPFEHSLLYELERNLWPSKCPDFRVAPQAVEAIQQVTSGLRRSPPRPQALELSPPPSNPNNRNSEMSEDLPDFFTVAQECEKCFFVQCRVILEDLMISVSDVALLPFRNSGQHVSTFLWNLCTEPSAPVLTYRNKNNELRQLLKEELKNEVSYQIVKYSISTGLKNLTHKKSIFTSTDQSGALLKRDIPIPLDVNHNGQVIGRKRMYKLPLVTTIKGNGGTLMDRFTQKDFTKSLPSLSVLEIIIPKSLHVKSA